MNVMMSDDTKTVAIHFDGMRVRLRDFSPACWRVRASEKWPKRQ